MGLENVLPLLSVSGAAAGGTFNALGARAQGRAIRTASDMNAQAIQYESGQQASRIRKSGATEIGRQRTLIGASGLQAAGSPLEFIAQNAAEIERQAMERSLAGQYDASVERNRGKIARKTASMASGAALLEGGTRAAYYGRSLL